VQDHAVILGVAAMAVRIPVPLADVYLHVALDQTYPFHFQQSVPKVGTGGMTGAAGVEDPNPKPVRRPERGLLRRPALPKLG
jgi:hypothetical protein